MTFITSANCATARQQLATDEHGRHWEHYFIENQYSFSNQIPTRSSYTATEPGKVFYDRGLCRWGSDNPSEVAAPNTASMSTEGIGGLGLLILVALAAAGVYAAKFATKTDQSTDYHPMADAPPLPHVEYNATAAAAAMGAAQPTAHGNIDKAPMTDGGGGGQKLADPNNDGDFIAPWDEPSPTVGEGSPTQNTDTVPTDDRPVAGGLDKLKGMSLKVFKEQLASHGITTESGAFKSVELLNYPGTENILHARMFAFWKEFSSRRVPHAVYFVFGLQDGGNRSAAFKEKYNTAKTWVQNWYSENLGND